MSSSDCRRSTSKDQAHIGCGNPLMFWWVEATLLRVRLSVPLYSIVTSVRKSKKISTLMDRTLPNKCTKFGAKIFRSYWIIIFLVFGHFLKPHPVYICEVITWYFMRFLCITTFVNNVKHCMVSLHQLSLLFCVTNYSRSILYCCTICTISASDSIFDTGAL